MSRIGELVEVLHTSDRRAIRAVGPVIAVERCAFAGRAWEIVTIRISLGRFGILDILEFAEHIRPAYTLAQEMRAQAETRTDPEKKSVDRVLRLSRSDPDLRTLPDASAQDRLAVATGWTRG